MPDINNMSPRSGQQLKDDNTVINTAAIIEAINTAFGLKDAAAVTDPTAAADLIALAKGLLKQLQGDGPGAAPVALTGSLTGAVVSASSTRPNDTTAYTALDVVGENPAANLIFNNVLSNAGGTFIITGARLRIDAAAQPSGMSSFRLHLYNAAPTAIVDNAAYNLPAADRAKYLGSILLSSLGDFGDTLYYQEDNVNLELKLAADSTTLYGILQTVGAFTLTAQTVKTITLAVAGV